MKKILLLFALSLFNVTFAWPQVKKPKLVIGIVVDQMREDYLYAYWDKYGENGFKKLVRKGFHCRNTHYNYVPTYTGPGHASIYTGATPAVHGIVGNHWFDRQENKRVYCAQDSTVSTIGAEGKAGQMSPHRMRSSTVGDELKIASGTRSKVIGIALKDRGSILPAGHAANAAYWFDDQSGNFISSSYYLSDLPEWVKAFNARKRAEILLSEPWTTLLPIDRYTESLPDDTPYEKPFKGEEKPVFPHNLPAIRAARGGDFALIKSTPAGNTLTKEFALAALIGENLGRNGSTDMLCLSFSSTDYIGHQFGPKAIETEDTYLRLDRDLAEIISYLEKHIGKENFILFLTADHAASEVPAHLSDMRIPSGYTDLEKYVPALENTLRKAFPLQDTAQRFVKYLINQQVYLDHTLLEKQGFELEKVTEKTAAFFRELPSVAEVLTAPLLLQHEYTVGIRRLMYLGFQSTRSGDVLINLQPGWVEYYTTGTTHGSPYSYDTHIPLLWYGAIPKGFSVRKMEITQIAPTLSQLLSIPFPNSSDGRVIEELFRK